MHHRAESEMNVGGRAIRAEINDVVTQKNRIADVIVIKVSTSTIVMHVIQMNCPKGWNVSALKWGEKTKSNPEIL